MTSAFGPKGSGTFHTTGDFGFDISTLAIRTPIETDVNSDEFTDMEYLTEGSNSHIFSAKWRGQIVIVKMLQVEKAQNTVALNEFEIEVELLSRLNNPGIIKILGAGTKPRPYIILERLRDLNVMLGLNNPDSGSSFMSRNTFTLQEVLKIAKDLADALDYIHTQVHRDAMIIHRDLKPENLGLSADGRLKLFDFGLCRCVQKRTSENDAYEMTGNTGSLRYMAPEVVLNRGYNEKVDVFSFAVVMWTIAREKVPYKGYDRAMHRSRVVIGGERPKLDSSWPESFNNLLESCWHQESIRRPSMAEVSATITRIMERDLKEESKGGKGLLRKISNAFSSTKK